MNKIDLILLAFVAAGTLGGFATGFVKATANLAGLVLGFVVGSAFFPALAPFFLRWTGSLTIAGLLSFTVIALAVALVLDALGTLVTRLVKMIHLQVLNRPLGLLPAALSTCLVAGVTLALLNGFALFERERAESHLAGWFLEISAPIVELLPPPWNGVPQELPPRPLPAPDAPLMAQSHREASRRRHCVGADCCDARHLAGWHCVGAA